mmetsp:Transcript_1037/g.2939  ORF Transcript_1037/g.2939 Transcript_1037/m.2939 type:complete len:279 (-) Transcript_1037:307-1143(-)
MHVWWVRRVRPSRLARSGGSREEGVEHPEREGGADRALRGGAGLPPPRLLHRRPRLLLAPHKHEEVVAELGRAPDHQLAVRVAEAELRGGAAAERLQHARKHLPARHGLVADPREKAPLHARRQPALRRQTVPHLVLLHAGVDESEVEDAAARPRSLQLAAAHHHAGQGEGEGGQRTALELDEGMEPTAAAFHDVSHAADLAAARRERVHGQRPVGRALLNQRLDRLAEREEEGGGTEGLHVREDELPRPVPQGGRLPAALLRRLLQALDELRSGDPL